MTDELPPAVLLADSAGLDFLNSRAVPVDTEVDWLVDGAALLSWLGQAGLVKTEQLDEVRKSAVPGEFDAVAAQARALREWFRGFVQAHKGTRLTGAVIEELEPLSRLLARDEVFGQIEIASAEGDELAPVSELKFVLQRRWRRPDTLLLPIAKAMAELVTSVDFTHVKSCEGPTCTHHFLDTTRGRIRRWCSMAICGNRAKQALHRARLRTAKEETS